jgi:triosephosphate isomerase
LGAQDCHVGVAGAHTGDLSATMLKDAGAGHIIVGHSERRANHHESDDLIRQKAEAALAAGLTAILCVGETEAERASGQTMAVVDRQLRGSWPATGPAARMVLAYEPVWAIGSGRVPSLADVQEVHEGLRQAVSTVIGDAAVPLRILYGGSMKPANARDLLALPDVDGGLIGGASLDAQSFWAIALASPGAHA